MSKLWRLKTSYTFLQSNSSNDEPIRHITPNFGGTSIEYRKNKCIASLYSAYNQEFKSSQFTQGELNDAYLYTIGSDGLPFTAGWFTLNLKGNYQISENLNLNAGIENILDKRYRPYGSGITAAGRNFSIAFRASF